jgi:hypothetical protein
MSFDKQHKLHSIPARFGKKNTLCIAGISFVISAFLLFATGYAFALNTCFYAIATIIALLYRSNDIIFYANKKILKRSPFCTYKKMLVYTVIFAFVVFLCKIFKDNILHGVANFGAFIIWGVICTPLSVIAYAFATFVVDKNVRKLILTKIKK